uniref:4Fe-4S ferredoxin n=1 Tax=candidate division WOR-3 bacterium TaxID=2052148 RepID=A0A7C4UDP5_UNCW3
MKRIKKEKFKEEIFKLGRKVIAPSGDRFSFVEGKEHIKMESLLTRLPPKTFYFPYEERLFYFRDGEIITDNKDERFVLFGLRPCESRAYSTFDKTFWTDKFPDPYYIERKKNTLIISIGCNNPLETCFCTSLGGSPFDTEGSDLLLIEKDDWYYAIGKDDVLKLFSFEESDEDIEDIKKKSLDILNKNRFETNSLVEKLEKVWDTDFFTEVSRKCLTCGACTFLCPTCYCFDIEDKEREDGIKRVRVWDSCMFKIYTQEASGHNPRIDESKRMRQRVMHKFSYYPSSYNVFGCVGCGRCITYCPVNIDIREILKEVMKR